MPSHRTLATFGAALLSLAAVVRAAPAAELSITPAQMQALGVTLLKLDGPGEGRGLPYPARVIVPPEREQMVGAALDGVVDRLLVASQDSVRAGQPLLRMLSPAFGDLQLKLLESAAKSRLSNKTLLRERQLFAEGIIAERRVQEAEAAWATDSARVRQAQAELRLAGADAATITRIQEGGAPESALVVRAREAGLVLSIDVKPGQRVRAGDPLLRIADLRSLWLEITLPVDRQPSRSTQATVVGREAAGTIQSVGSVASDSQTVIARARVTRGGALLRPGEAVQVELPLSGPRGWVVPLRAIAREDGKAYLFVRSAKGFVATPVEVLGSAGDTASVSGPLKAGQDIAATSVLALKAAWLGKGGGN